MNIETTAYYQDFIRYFKLAKEQQEKCNVSKNPPYGMIAHKDSAMNDALMENVELYDVVERKYAGFSQIVNDCFYGWSLRHPYWEKMKANKVTDQRKQVANDWTGKHFDFSLPEWLYIFILHRVCGSGINYAQKPSGYHNTLLFKLHRAKTIEEMCLMIKNEQNSFYTSVGYQFPSFPKPSGGYKRGGDYYLCEFAPRLARDLADWLASGSKKTLREIGAFMLNWNTNNGLKQYHFQYAAIIADIADWYPQFVIRDSMFFYGSNAEQCISYLAKPLTKMKTEVFLDTVMEMACKDTGEVPYNVEDVCCDYIRYCTNYVRLGEAYDAIDRDAIWNSSKIIHPYGRQKAMLDLGLVKTFNDPSQNFYYDEVIKANGLTPAQYIKLVQEHPDYKDWIGVPDKFPTK
jgi:hypothetical protein